MVIRLGHAIPQAKPVDAPQVSLDDALVGIHIPVFGLSFQPAKKGRAEVKTHHIEIAQNSIGFITLGCDLFVEIGIGLSSQLTRDFPSPGILPRRLVEVTMKYEITLTHTGASPTTRPLVHIGRTQPLRYLRTNPFVAHNTIRYLHSPVFAPN